MALERMYGLKCDTCGCTYTIGPDTERLAWYDTPRHARADAKRHGWYSPKVGYGERRKDYCPLCADRMESQEE